MAEVSLFVIVFSSKIVPFGIGSFFLKLTFMLSIYVSSCVMLLPIINLFYVIFEFGRSCVCCFSAVSNNRRPNTITTTVRQEKRVSIPI